LPGTGAIARALIEAAAPVNGHPGDPETPLITAASYGDAEVARVLIEAGADIDAVSAPNSGALAAAQRYGRLIGRLTLTDALGGPVCAAVRPPLITWSASAAG